MIKEITTEQKMKVLEEICDHEMRNILTAVELGFDKEVIEEAVFRHRNTQEAYKPLLSFYQRIIQNFYVDNLLFTNGSDSSINYKIIYDVFFKELMIEGQTPYGLCMGIKEKTPIHEYKAIDKLRPYEFVHGSLPSHGVCPSCLDYHMKDDEEVLI